MSVPPGVSIAFHGTLAYVLGFLGLLAWSELDPPLAGVGWGFGWGFGWGGFLILLGVRTGLNEGSLLPPGSPEDMVVVAVAVVSVGYVRLCDFA